MEFVYVVWGEVGEYSDKCHWFVAAYPDEETADHHVKVAREAWEKAKEEAEDEEWGWCYTVSEEFIKIFPFDRNTRESYGDPKWYVAKVPLCLHVDQYQERFPVEENK